MQSLLEVILPVFLVIGAGYLTTWRGILDDRAIDGLVRYSQQVAIPCLLFQAIWTLDLGANFNLSLLASYYSGAVTGFVVGLLAGRYLFKREWEDAVAIGFCCLFANSLMLGIPITERAYGPDALQSNYAIISVHSPICYGIGITAMEIVRARGAPLRALPGKVLGSVFRNALVIGILLGATANFTSLQLPETVTHALDMVIRTAIPTALFGLGGVLYRYRPQGDGRTIAFVCAVTLLLNPAITWVVGKSIGISTEGFRSAVLTAAMAPGINTYVFANMYGRARRVAASSVLLATGMCIVTTWAWLHLLP